ncbi:saccharopine dehydrogenase family protein [Sphingopyxis sp. MSC1_008]|jgi:short subunit dehydrogenase-like uncharacterized protein|uniref:saccharopine dehydrogenase family protein n=1 Tax=Sphingopyxis sp. MSC1_008 TaxID=2909265 RepID=UPI0020C113D2|nr:saccharopine dehydrogenase NADP-binding domain-containing protein [Sphingopyxis sp. MSC1_008]
MTDFDIIVCGATGYTGQRVCEHLAQGYGSELSWAIAGRNMAKLEDIRTRFAVPSHVELIEADITDPAAAASLARRTKTIISTAGPFATVGEPLVAACAQSGTDYVDISGDAVWIRKMFDRYQDAAIASGARLIFTCGFDSVPSDLGVFLLQEAARERFGAPAITVKGRIRRLVGGLSGGTLASGRASIAAAGADPSIPQLLANPFALVPDFAGPAQPAEKEVAFDPDVESWVAPFILAGMNAKSVHLSNALLGWPYGKDFIYDERIMLPEAIDSESARTAADANIWSNVVRALQIDLKPGEGPSEEELAAGSFEILFVGHTAAGQEIRTTIAGKGDPYALTPRIVAECALCLTEGTSPATGGVWTAAAALGARLQRRLEERAGISFGVASPGGSA